MEDVKRKCFRLAQHISDKVLYLRRTVKLSQEKFAELTNLSARTISRIEEGKRNPSDRTLIMIANAFNLPISYFYDDSKYEITKEKTEIIDEINSKLNIATTDELVKINSLVSVLILTKK